VSCCTAPGQRQFRLTTAGCRQIGGTSGLGYVSLVLGRRARGRSPLGSIALDPLARVNWGSSRRRFAPFSKDSGQAACTSSRQSGILMTVHSFPFQKASCSHNQLLRSGSNGHLLRHHTYGTGTHSPVINAEPNRRHLGNPFPSVFSVCVENFPR
jgi:hypothetical protein